MTSIVLFGGTSDERHVSVATAQNVVRALGRPLCWFWAPDGKVYDVAADQVLAHERAFEIDFDPRRPAMWPDLDQALDTLPVEDPVFFLALHGGAGEDGTVQRMMERRGIAFTGSGSEASAAAFDKARAKAILGDRVRTPESRTADAKTIQSVAAAMLERYPKIVLKPLAGGSSRGLLFLSRGDAVPEISVPYIVEQFIEGRELTVGVIDLGRGPFPLPVIEIEIDAGRTFDYLGKYLGQGTREICPANISTEMATNAQIMALAAHKGLGSKGYSRTDIMADGKDMYFLELNTLPGLTTSSLVPQELRTAGIDFRDFLEKQLALAVNR
jgi:D-alanine-D-alanine ligase